MLYCGHGYTDVGVGQMTTTEREWHVRRLTEQLKIEKAEREQAQREAAAKSKGKKGRRK